MLDLKWSLFEQLLLIASKSDCLLTTPRVTFHSELSMCFCEHGSKRVKK